MPPAAGPRPWRAYGPTAAASAELAAKTPEWLTKNEATAALDSTHEVASFPRPHCPRLPRPEGLIPA